MTQCIQNNTQGYGHADNGMQLLGKAEYGVSIPCYTASPTHAIGSGNGFKQPTLVPYATPWRITPTRPHSARLARHDRITVYAMLAWRNLTSIGACWHGHINVNICMLQKTTVSVFGMG